MLSTVSLPYRKVPDQVTSEHQASKIAVGPNEFLPFALQQGKPND